ncbi:MAG: tetratricopeptide repeat protein [Eubacterium sp.]|nr:tetratricopeptide repeat protein [Eubacterium sp.]
MEETKKESKKKKWPRVLAVVIVLVMILTPVLTLKTQIAFSRQRYAGETESYAALLTEEETGYLTDSRMDRVWKYLKTLGGNPKTYEEYEVYAQVAIGREDFASAETYLKGCIETYTGDDAHLAYLYLRLASICILEQKTESASAMLDKALELDSSLAAAYYLKGQLAAEAGDGETAVSCFRKYINSQDSDPAVTASLGSVFEALDDTQTAVSCYTAGIDAGTNDPQLYAGRARCRLLAGENTAAKADLDVYFSMTEEDPEGQPAAMMGVCLMEEGAYEEAAAHFRKSVADGYADPALIYSQLVVCEFACGDYENAVKDGVAAIDGLKKLGMDTADAEFWTGLSYLAQNKYKGAYAHLTQAKEKNEDYPDINYYLGVCLLAQEDYETAVGCFSFSIERGEQVTSSFYNRAVCFLKLGLDDQAKADLESGVALGDDPELTEQAQLVLDSLAAEE